MKKFRQITREIGEIVVKSLERYGYKIDSDDVYAKLYWVSYNPITRNISLIINIVELNTIVHFERGEVSKIVQEIIRQTSPKKVAGNYEAWESVKITWKKEN